MEWLVTLFYSTIYQRLAIAVVHVMDSPRPYEAGCACVGVCLCMATAYRRLRLYFIFFIFSLSHFTIELNNVAKYGRGHGPARTPPENNDIEMRETAHKPKMKRKAAKTLKSSN